MHENTKSRIKRLSVPQLRYVPISCPSCMTQQSPKLKRVCDIFTLLELVIGSRYPSTKGAETHAGKDLREHGKGRRGCLKENSWLGGFKRSTERDSSEALSGD